MVKGMARKGKDGKVRQSTGGRVPYSVRYSSRSEGGSGIRPSIGGRVPSRVRYSGGRHSLASRGSRKSGWYDESRRHSLARMGVSTVLPDGRRLAVNNFVAGGKWKTIGTTHSLGNWVNLIDASKQYRIMLYAEQDLDMVGLDTSEDSIDSFEDAWIEAVEQIGEMYGLEVYPMVYRGKPDSSTMTYIPNMEVTVEDEIWQMAHDMVREVG